MSFNGSDQALDHPDQFVRQGFSQRLNDSLNQAINRELVASYTYLSMAQYFSRADVALHGFAKHFLVQSHEEQEHGQLLIRYINERGGNVEFFDVKKPRFMDWGSPLSAFEAVLNMETWINEELKKSHEIATVDSDGSASDFLEGTFLQNQVREIKEAGDFLSKLKRVGHGVGFHLIDQELLAKYDTSSSSSSSDD
ncbi:hypothetical protein TCAL_10892 [Tigriopus californicus]|uniref:Ferritin n=1 Tax=Tigriopus californicus TaxID=6832 RepID=A0A553NCD2_TIGCA|nr:soma ferritin-like [Tigriopus californicus]TRY63058.1 hypothetical protein TCAL_10892 [Tigriopus californicus]|eukprot:TCALIF_10892-PA protein Name:"Similar to Soma ferritin (Lymnaea stagnalis)" AED:0.50 eAED:0.50 QI:0/0/0/1/1/1/2/0/195